MAPLIFFISQTAKGEKYTDMPRNVETNVVKKKKKKIGGFICLVKRVVVVASCKWYLKKKKVSRRGWSCLSFFSCFWVLKGHVCENQTKIVCIHHSYREPPMVKDER